MYIVKRVLLVVFILTLSISSASVCCAVNKDEARKADMIANPDRYTEHISTGSGIGLYMDNASISVERYDPPHYIIRFDVFCVSHPPTGGCNVYEATSERIYFDWNNKKAYRYEKDRETGVEGWKEISRNNYLWKFTRFANAAFRAAYNMDFFSQNQIW